MVPATAIILFFSDRAMDDCGRTAESCQLNFSFATELCDDHFNAVLASFSAFGRGITYELPRLFLGLRVYKKDSRF